MRAGFNCSRVIAGGNNCCRDAVHDALVVGRRAVGIRCRERIGLEDLINDLSTFHGISRLAQRFFLVDCACSGKSVSSEVGEDAQINFSACDLLYVRCDRFCHGVDRVRAHRVADIDQQVKDDHRACLGLDNSHVEVMEAASEFHENRVLIVADLLDIFLMLQNSALGEFRCRHIHDLHLRDHDRSREGGGETAGHTGHLGRVGSCCNDGRLLCDHGDDHVLAVDDKVKCHTHRKRVGSDDVLNHLVRKFYRERRLRDLLSVLFGNACLFYYCRKPLLRAEFIKTGKTALHM